jgi:hypothetical protein
MTHLRFFSPDNADFLKSFLCRKPYRGAGGYRALSAFPDGAGRLYLMYSPAIGRLGKCSIPS